MGRSTSPSFVAEVFPKSGGSPWTVVWDCKWNGRPTANNVYRYLVALNASVAPGGANEHLGESGEARKVVVYRNRYPREFVCQAEA